MYVFVGYPLLIRELELEVTRSRMNKKLQKCKDQVEELYTRDCALCIRVLCPLNINDSYSSGLSSRQHLLSRLKRDSKEIEQFLHPP